MVAESHLPASVARNIHATEEDAGVVGGSDNGVRAAADVGAVAAAAARRSSQLVLDILMVLLVDNIVHAVAVNQQVLLRKKNKERKMKNPSISRRLVMRLTDNRHDL